jgi:adenylate cyclase
LNFIRDFDKTIAAWLLAMGMLLLIRFFGSSESAIWAAYPVDYLWAWLGGSLVLALADRTTEVVCASRPFRRRPYLYHQFIKLLGMTAALLLVIGIFHLLGAVQGNIAFNQLPETIGGAFTDPTLLIALAYILIMSALFGFIRQLRAMIGKRVMKNLMLGRYHFPKSETRIFMFLDLKGSTTHAEYLGHTRFCRLIQDCFEDLTDSGLRHEVEVYQYVGDEAILTWTPKAGVCNANCLWVFFDFMDSLNNRAEYYRSQYGLVPEFKAGVNYGEVTVAEVGVLKREISYLSDVLNTAARLEGECNKLGQKLLISGELAEIIGQPEGLTFTEMGSLPLRGKSDTVRIVAVAKSGTDS